MSHTVFTALAFLQTPGVLIAGFDPHLVETGLVGCIVGLGQLFSGRNSKKREGHLTRIEKKIDAYQTQLTEVDTIVRGVDGDNGLRYDMRQVKYDMNVLRENGYLRTTPAPFPASHLPKRNDSR